jgi:hypothetical protein
VTAEQVRAVLPVIEAFANRRPLQVRRRNLHDDWITINPDTTEFRFYDLADNQLEWRVVEDGQS